MFIAFALFMAHRFTRPLLFFEVAKAYERPQAVIIPEGLGSVSSDECANCHEQIVEEWKTTIHANAWKDPYFLIDYEFDGSLQICLNCHTPLVNQQESLVTGFRDSDKLDPILVPNPNFDKALQDEGVTCAVCHIKDGFIVGPNGVKTDAHPVKKDERFSDGSGVCKRCHWVQGDRWDVFLKLPPCGNFAEIEETGKKIDCVKCHMPKVTRSHAVGAPKRKGGSHTWRGGHDRDMVKQALKVDLIAESENKYRLDLTNIGTEHRLPTGTPDRHLLVIFRALDKSGQLIYEKKELLERVILWRPFIVDLWDTRLRYNETRSYEFVLDQKLNAAALEVSVEYGLLHEKRRERIGYKNKKPIKYSLFYKKIDM